ncbi:MAG: ribulokinase, partial [Planctomycetes bacterium]|nr:ribulokinase [Planctomycetota bacterium]
MNASSFALGLDFGTSSVRALLVNTANGHEVATASTAYATGDHGVMTSPTDADIARQHPGDHIAGAITCVRRVLELASAKGIASSQIVGIGVDTTGSTPLPVDAKVRPLALIPQFARELAAQAWLWKDHSSHAEAAEITNAATNAGLPYLTTCGGTYSSEWFWSKLLHCARHHPQVMAAAA